MAIEKQILIIIWISIITVDYILGSIMLNKMLCIKTEKMKKTYFRGATLFFLTHSTCRVFFFLETFFFTELQILTQIAAILGCLSIIFIVSALESAIYTKTKHIFTIYGLIGLVIDIIDLFLMNGLFTLVQTFFFNPITVFIIIIYFSHIFKSTGTVRNHFILMTLGIIIFGAGEVGNTLYDVFWWMRFGAPLLMLTGLVLLFISIVKYYKEPEPSTTIIEEMV